MGLISKLLGHASDLTPEQARQELQGILLPDEPVQVAFKLPSHPLFETGSERPRPSASYHRRHRQIRRPV